MSAGPALDRHVHWVVWEVLEEEAMLALIIGFDPKSSTAISKCHNKSFNGRHINMEERHNDEEGKIFTQVSGSPGLSMSRVCYERTNKEFERKQKSSWNWSPSVAVPISHNIYWKELSMLVYVSVAFLIVKHWVVWEVLEEDAMLALIIGFDPKSSTAISKCHFTKGFSLKTGSQFHYTSNKRMQSS
ncbi:hypothetical protein ACE6H2_011890 [Prunus campanulata]